jgi:hypothetical protein
MVIDIYLAALGDVLLPLDTAERRRQARDERRGLRWAFLFDLDKRYRWSLMVETQEGRDLVKHMLNHGLSERSVDKLIQKVVFPL